MAIDTTRAALTRCGTCGSERVEICLPAFFPANGNLDVPASVDYEAEALSYWCASCEDNVAARLPDGELRCGRWDR